MTHSSRTLYTTASGVEVGINEHRNVALRLVDFDSHDTGLVPGVALGIELTPEEARRLAQSLLRKADEAQAG